MGKTKILFKKDQFRKARGGVSRLLDISCSKCGTHICFYQKDGPGMLKRMYLDRIFESEYSGLENNLAENIPQFICPNCKEHLGTPIIYEKEKRSAFRLFVGGITKKIVKED